MSGEVKVDPADVRDSGRVVQVDVSSNGQGAELRSESSNGAGPAASVARARLEALLEPGTFQPLRSAVGDGVVAGSGRIAGRRVCIWAQDVSFRGGSLGVGGGETIARTMARASRAGVPVIGLPHSGGARLQEGVAALSAYGTIFRQQAVARVPQISVICGTCAGGAAYSPAMGDFVIMVQPDARLFLTGPAVIEKVAREQVDAVELGGPRVHSANGVAHLVVDDHPAAGRLLRQLLDYLPSVIGDSPPVRSFEPPAGDPSAPLPATMRNVYDVRDVVDGLLDVGEQLELGRLWARNMVTTLGRLGGRAVGVIANQPRYLGGTIDSAASEKGAWFVNLCDRFRIPLVVLVDTPGFLPGRNQERAGVIRYGAALLRAFGRATTPKLTVTLRQAYGGAHIVMNSRDLGADLTLAWPQAQIGIMGPHQAVEITGRKQIAAGADPDELIRSYAAENAIEVAAVKGFVDEIVDPRRTRERLIEALALHSDVGAGGGGSEIAVDADLGGYRDAAGRPQPLL